MTEINPEIFQLNNRVVMLSERMLNASHIHELRNSIDEMIQAMSRIDQLLGGNSYVLPQIRELEAKIPNLKKFYS